MTFCRFAVASLALSTLLVAACTIISGVDDYRVSELTGDAELDAGPPGDEGVATLDDGSTPGATIDAGNGAIDGSSADVDAAPAFQVTAMRLIDLNTLEPLTGYDPLPGSVTLSRAILANATLEARVGQGVGSVTFRQNGTVVQVESLPPYTITYTARDTGTAPWTPPLGAVAVTGTPYSDAGASGRRGPELTVRFTIQP